MMDRPRGKPSHMPRTRSYKELPGGKKVKDPVERYERRYSVTPGKEPTQHHTVRNPVEFAEVRGRLRNNRTAADVTTMSKKSAFVEGFCEMLSSIGWSSNLVKEAARSLEGYEAPAALPEGPLGLAAGVASAMIPQQLSQLTDMGDRILEAEKAQKRRLAQHALMRGT